jgi:thiol-disulfide isomerase/thioredoxin
VRAIKGRNLQESKMTRTKSAFHSSDRVSVLANRNHWLMRLSLLLLFVGCGTSQREVSTSPTQDDRAAAGESPVIELPAIESPAIESTAEAVAAAARSAPGGLELPPGEIPSASTPAESTSAGVASGGIEMPADVTVPVESSTESSPAIEFATWEQIQAAARSTGRITVVDLWSLACEPCLKEFPGLVKLHQSMGTKVQCMAVDLDYDGRKSRPPEFYRQEVIAFLQSVGAEGFPLFISTTPSDDVFAAAELSSIPAVLVFDAKGELVKAFVDAGETAGFTYEKDIVPFVSKLAG